MLKILLLGVHFNFSSCQLVNNQDGKEYGHKSSVHWTRIQNYIALFSKLTKLTKTQTCFRTKSTLVHIFLKHRTLHK